MPPRSEEELLTRVDEIAGLSLSELASLAGIKMPKDLSKHKGWSGQLIEYCLGANAGSKPEQDFTELKIELKTIPISHQFTAIETTYVCYAHLTGTQGLTWANCNVRNKLSKVLWIPVQGEREIPLNQRIIGTGFLWQPNRQQEHILQNDWEELMDMISLGHVEQITAKVGQALQLRPKAANGSILTAAIGENGQHIQTRPRGFYLRKSFTNELLNNAFN